MKLLAGFWPYISSATGIVLILSLIFNSVWLDIAFYFMGALLFTLLAIEVSIQQKEKKNSWLLAIVTVLIVVLLYFGVNQLIKLL